MTRMLPFPLGGKVDRAASARPIRGRPIMASLARPTCALFGAPSPPREEGKCLAPCETDGLLRPGRPVSVDVGGVERGRAADVEAVALRATETHVGHDFGDLD